MLRTEQIYFLLLSFLSRDEASGISFPTVLINPGIQILLDLQLKYKKNLTALFIFKVLVTSTK